MGNTMAQFLSSATVPGSRIRNFTSLYEEHTGRNPMVRLAEGWELSQPVRRSGYAPVKRMIDVFFTVLLSPIWIVLGAVVWVVVKLDSRGSAIHRQDRTGRNDRPFTLYKFRTIINNAEQDGPRFAAGGLNNEVHWATSRGTR